MRSNSRRISLASRNLFGAVLIVLGSACGASQPNRSQTFTDVAQGAFRNWRAAIQRTTDATFKERALALVTEGEQRLMANEPGEFSIRVSAVMALALTPESFLSSYERHDVYQRSAEALAAGDTMQRQLDDKPVEPSPIANTTCKKQSNCEDCQCAYEKGSTCTPNKAGGKGLPVCECFGCSTSTPSGPGPFDPDPVIKPTVQP
jgi:hypothetical protein